MARDPNDITNALFGPESKHLEPTGGDGRMTDELARAHHQIFSRIAGYVEPYEGEVGGFIPPASFGIGLSDEALIMTEDDRAETETVLQEWIDARGNAATCDPLG